MIMIHNNWFYNDKEILEISDLPDYENIHGFVYCITTEHGRKYIGKKILQTKRKRKFGKKESALVTDKRKKLYEHVVKESDWKTYVGSNDELKNDIKKGINYTKEILYLARNSKNLSYYETKELFVQGVLEHPKVFYNANILGKFFGKDI